MSVKTMQVRLEMAGDTHIENITKHVQKYVTETGLREGTVTVFIRHTTASVVIVEDEPGIRIDTKKIWDRLIPAEPGWEHNIRNGDDNAHSHLRAHLQGPSVTIPFVDGDLLLGTWQQVVVVDFDTRSRKRDIVIQVMGD